MLSRLLQQTCCRLLFSSGAAVHARLLSAAAKTAPDVATAELPLVALVGRPNVGKSALFNRLVRRKQAVVYNTPEGHVTRDWREGAARLGGLSFTAVDTSGLEPFLPAGTIQARATLLTQSVLRRADAALLLLDARQGVLPADSELAAWLRRTCTARLLLVANKCERRAADGTSGVADALVEATRLGLGEPVAVSAETGEGMDDLFAALAPLLQEVQQERAARAAQAAQAAAEASEGGQEAGPLRMAVMGLPNVGKSTLTNQLLGETRSLTGPEAGLTRDPVRAAFAWRERQVHLVDTAGWMRRTRLASYDDSGGAVAAATLQEATRSMQLADVVVLVLDATAVLGDAGGLSKREVALAADVAAEGRALVLAVNKLDLLPSDQQKQAMKAAAESVQRHLPELAGLPLIGLSALTGSGTGQVMPAVVRMHERWAQRLPTARLNKWLAQVAAKYQVVGSANQVGRVRYLTQVKGRPPTFAAWVGGGTPFSDASHRFLANALRREFGFEGIPIRVLIRYKRAQRDQSRRRPSSTRKGAAAAA